MAAVVDDLFDVGAGQPRLLAGRCDSCELTYFPYTPRCRNPQCSDSRIGRVSLPSRGVLYSFTIQRYQPPALFRLDNWSAYAIGLVEIKPDLRVMARLINIAFDDLCIGLPVRLVDAALCVEPNGETLYSYAFEADTYGDERS